MEPTSQDRRAWGLLRQRSCLVPTWRGWLVAILFTFLVAFAAVHALHPFLAVNDPLSGGILVVEGWAPDYALKEAAEELHRHNYQKLYVTGGPLEVGGPLSEYKTYAELATAVFLKLGLSTNEVQAVPAAFVPQDRTYASALVLRAWLQAHGIPCTRVHLISKGPHARRSRLLFSKAFGPGVAIGVTAVPSHEYDARHWWRSSAGVRTVLDEAIGYAYARCFKPKEPHAP